LNIVVADDLDAIAPGIPEIKKMPIYWSYAGNLEGAPGCLLVIDDETEVAARICALIPPFCKAMNWSPRSMNAIASLLPRSSNLKIRP
jgi:hypothetical protein